MLGGSGREEQIRGFIKQRFGVEPEDLTPEQRQELMQELRSRQRGASCGG